MARRGMKRRQAMQQASRSLGQVILESLSSILSLVSGSSAVKEHPEGMASSLSLASDASSAYGLVTPPGGVTSNLKFWMPSRNLSQEYRWEDTGKTTPAATNNDPVRVLTDQSDSLLDGVATSDGQRPLINLSSGRNHSLVFNDTTGNKEIDFATQSRLKFIHETGVFTISFWVKLANTTDGTQFFFDCNDGSSGANKGWNILRNTTDLTFRVGNGLTVINITRSGVLSSAAAPYFICFRGNGTQVDGWVNGTKTANVGSISNLGTTGDTLRALRIGRRTTNASPFNGELDDLLIYSSALTDQQVTDIYNAG